MTEREIRKAKRLQTIVVNKTSLYSDDNSALHIGLSALESWELLAKISQDSWFLETGKVAPLSLDKSKVKIFTKVS